VTEAAASPSEGEPRPAPVPAPPAAAVSGRQRAEQVTALLGTLAGLRDAPLTEHVERYQEVHAELQAALTSIDGG
jgi:hypothetical protein